MTAVHPIPHPPRLPIIGNLPQVFGDTIVQELVALARQYYPIYEMVIPGTRFYVISSHELVREVCDEKRFHKAVHGVLMEIRRFAGDGLFTALPGEPNWSKAHNILLPGFGLKQMKEYLPKMLEVAQQLLQKWQVVGEQGIDVSADFTRLTLDTIALCGFDHRFRSFASDQLHPFLDAMILGLQNSAARIKKTKLQNALDKKSERQFNAGRDLMFRVVDELLAERHKNAEKFKDKVDFLSLMLNGMDKKTGEKLDFENIRYQLITFLIAGHETTSGLLSFATYFLVSHPEVMQKAVEEVDRVLGRDPDYQLSFKDIGDLKYLNHVLRETLRLWPTAPAFARTPYEDTIIGDRYEIKKGEEVLVLLPALHRDPAVWKDPEAFDPDRFAAGAEDKIPEYAWRPFGTGARSCIGQHFAMVEATAALALILKHFEIKGEPDYKLKVKETLTLKPADFRIKAFPRLPLHRAPVAFKAEDRVPVATREQDEMILPQHGTALAIYYGSNMGTSEELAQRLAQQGRRLGFVARVAALDDAVEAMPNSGIVLIVTATYNGMPPDNAQRFAEWMRSDRFRVDGLRFAVLGCGNTQWKTFQAFPREIDRTLAAKGGIRLLDAGEADANADFENGCEQFTKGFWKETLEELNLELPTRGLNRATPKRYQVQVVQHSPLRPLHASYQAKPFRVVANHELYKVEDADGTERSTRHIELQLPEGMSYRVGDHLGVFAHNRDHVVEAVALRLGFATDTLVTLEQQQKEGGFLPTGRQVALGRLLREYIELQEVVSRRHLETLASHCLVQEERQTLSGWAQDTTAGHAQYQQEVLNKRRSIYDILCAFPSCHLPLDAFLDMAAPIRPRYYSISSSPLTQARTVSLTVGVVAGPSLAANGTFKGVCSSFLQSREIGDAIFAFVKAPTLPFTLPQDAERPIIMVGPGTGFAPFRGFLQERLALKNAGKNPGPALLFFGCRWQDKDFIYRTEMEGFQQQAVTELHCAFSHQEGSAFRYVQDRIWEQRNRVWELLQKNAVIFVCGDGLQMAPDVRAMFARIYADKTGKDAAAAEAWLKDMENGQRYLVDVFGQKKT
ncbi:bifunctional cytochrome P450/NADPH--P450 reductase [Oligoflexus tunisiensis]|uniref:bifunctional cytochrome P450/NADPH--P450 reductase n=1 Tax=Oligoflexus tunisiensis TaxID=708132 RepID=UPI000A9363D4|nr:cytochrome P450 [Oligoflexus tunisiensis]